MSNPDVISERVYCTGNNCNGNEWMWSQGQMWNNPMMYIVWMWMMRWMNGNENGDNYNSRAI